MEKEFQIFGRQTLSLLNSNLGNLPIYYVFIYNASGCSSGNRKLQRQFFWGDSVDKKKMHLVKWDVISKKKENGGLAVKNLRLHNLSLIAKWWRRFSKEKNSLWVKVIRGKYNLDQGCWFPHLPASGQVTNIWKGICSITNTSSCISALIQEGFRVKIGSGQETLFWDHVWFGDRAIKEMYPRLYLISSKKREAVSALI